MVCCIFYSGLYGIGIGMYDDVCSISSGVGTEYVQSALQYISRTLLWSTKCDIYIPYNIFAFFPLHVSLELMVNICYSFLDKL